MNSPFFLTPQIANLMEDFTREIARDSSLYLLFGEAGVGKSRLLRNLRDSRLQGKTVHFVDFEEQDATSMSDRIGTLAETAQVEEVIIIDHFESAPNKAQQQVFESWSTDGEDKKLNLIVCADSSAFNRFRHLAGQFQAQVKSFQLKPCDHAESEAFLQHLLYPEQPFSQLVMNASLKRLLRQSKGLFSRLEEFADHHAGSIQIKPQQQASTSIGPPIIVLLLVCLLVGGGYLYYEYSSEPTSRPDEISAEIESVATSSEQQIDEKPEQESLTRQVEEPISIPQSDLQDELSDNIEIAAGTNDIAQPMETDQDRVVEDDSQWLEKLLMSSLEWINSSNIDRGTIQIMSIAFDRFDAESLRAFLVRLQQQGLDTEQLRLFETRAGENAVYSLIYGDFTDRHEANRQISDLPEMLDASNPIPRSAGSIAREIARFSSG